MPKKVASRTTRITKKGQPPSTAISRVDEVKLKVRDISLDLARGIIVMIMIFAHCVVFFNSNESLYLRIASQFGDVVSFTSFLFISGAVSYISYFAVLKDEDWPAKRKKLYTRILGLYLGYLIVGFASSAGQLAQLNLRDILRESYKIILFVRVPSYSEFLLAFMGFGLIIAFFRDVLKRLLKLDLLAVLFAIALYIIGDNLFRTSIPYPLGYYAPILWGEQGEFRFPLFQYMPVFMLGLLWGKYSYEASRKAKLFKLAILTMLCGIGFVLYNNFVTIIPPAGYKAGIFIDRWPPSVNFILIGLIFIFLLLLSVELSQAIKKVGVTRGLIVFIGKNAFSFYVWHMLILLAYRYSFNRQIGDPVSVVILFWLVLLLTAILVILSSRLSKKLNFEFMGTRIKAVKSKRTAKPVIFLVLVVAVVISAVFLYRQAINDSKGNTSDNRNVEGVVTEEKQPFWWNERFKFNKQLTIINSDPVNAVKAGTFVRIEINHKELVAAGKSQRDGNDIQALYFDDGEYVVLNTYVENSNSEKTAVIFPLSERLSTNKTNGDFFLYYGSEEKAQQITDKPTDIASDKVQFRFGDELSKYITNNISRNWILKGNKLDKTEQELKIESQFINIDVAGRNVKFKLTGPEDITIPAELNKDGNYETTLSAANLEPGKYSVTVEVEGSNFKSDTKSFNVSYPLYVTWTIDWEGFDVRNSYLDSMAAIADSYGVPMTHLFNPRIYIAPEINATRRKQLSDWVLKRKSDKGEEIGLHLHMHQDMATAALLTAKTEPRWGGRTNGHDVLTTAYNYDEFLQLLNWSIDQFQAYGLPYPVSYRAGGWFMNEENLRALETVGIKLDSSGREYYIWGPNKVVGEWNLSSTTKPYKMSRYNQNSSQPPQMDLWQFPNNGMDSTNNNADKLISKFTDNYKGSALNEPQVVTYLSHPHWFDVYDKPQMEKLLDYIKQYNFGSDSGPVKYVTLEGALAAFES